MKWNPKSESVIWLVILLAMSIVHTPIVLAQHLPPPPEDSVERAQKQVKMEQIVNNKAAYAAAIVSRWEDAVRASGRWDESFTTDLQNALVALDPTNLLAAGEAESYEALMQVIASGGRASKIPTQKELPHAASISTPQAIGSVSTDLVYTPVTPCRIIDTRNAGGAFSGIRGFDVDNTTSFAFQGGFNGPCGIPYGVARAVAMTITVTQPVGYGYFSAWAYGASQPLASLLNYVPGETIANTTIVPVAPGVGIDFYIYSLASAHAIVDVVGFWAAPTYTPLECTNASSAYISCPYNTWTTVDANCPTGYTATGGGHYTTEGSLGYPNVWLLSIPISNGWRIVVDNQNSNGPRNISAWARCCRLPGR